jgi:hypothetical protein
VLKVWPDYREAKEFIDAIHKEGIETGEKEKQAITQSIDPKN